MLQKYFEGDEPMDDSKTIVVNKPLQDMTKNERERILMEQIQLFADPKYSRKAAQIASLSSLYAPMTKRPPQIFERTKVAGVLVVSTTETPQSLMAGIAWDSLVERLGRYPSKWEVMNESRSMEAIFDTSSYTAVAAHAGFKPVDETKNEHKITSPLREYSEEELERIIVEERRKREEVVHAGQIAASDGRAETQETEAGI
jgi:hypothetical protein